MYEGLVSIVVFRAVARLKGREAVVQTCTGYGYGDGDGDGNGYGNGYGYGST